MADGTAVRLCSVPSLTTFERISHYQLGKLLGVRSTLVSSINRKKNNTGVRTSDVGSTLPLFILFNWNVFATEF